MKKGPDKLKSAKDKKVPESGTRKFNKGEKIRAGVKARIGQVVKEKTTVTKERTVSTGAEVSAGKKVKRKNLDRKKAPREKKRSTAGGKDTPANADTVVSAATSPVSPNVENVAEPAISVTAAPITTIPAVPTEQPPSRFESIAREVYKPEELIEFESLGISLDTAGQYVFIQKHSDGSIRTCRKFNPQVVKKLIDAVISGQKIVDYLYTFVVCRGWTVYAESILEWENNKLDIDFIERCGNKLAVAESVKFYAQYFVRHKEITWEDIPKYPAQFTSKQVEWLVFAGVRPENSLERAELFGDSEKDLFTPEQMEELRQDKVPADVRVAYNTKLGRRWEDSSILYFAKNRIRPALVEAYVRRSPNIADVDLVVFVRNFILPEEVEKYSAIYDISRKFTGEWRTKYVILLARNKTDPTLALQVYKKYAENGGDVEKALEALRYLVKAGVQLLQALEYPVDCRGGHDYRYSRDDHAKDCVVEFIKKGAAPKKVEEYFAKIPKVSCTFACECISAGMGVDDAKPYWEDGSWGTVDVIALWRAKISVDAAKPYRKFYGVGSTYEGDGQYSHNPSGEEIVRYIKDGVSPGIAALLRKADFAEDELQDAQRQFNKAETRSKIFKVVGGILAVAAAVGIGYKACHGCGVREEERGRSMHDAVLAAKKARVAPVAQATTQTTKTTAKHGDDTLDEKYARERAERNGVPFMTEREAIASDKMVKDAKGELVTKPGYKFLYTEGLNWAIVPRTDSVNSVSSSEDLSVECHYNFTPTPDGKGRVKVDCTKLDNEKLVIKGVFGDLPDSDPKYARAVITGTFNNRPYTCENAIFSMPEDRTQPQELNPSVSRTISCGLDNQ